MDYTRADCFWQQQRFKLQEYKTYYDYCRNSIVAIKIMSFRPLENNFKLNSCLKGIWNA